MRTPTFDNLMEALSRASCGDTCVRIDIPADADFAHQNTLLGHAINLLVEDLAYRQRENEQALHNLSLSEERLRTLLAHISAGIAQTDLTGRLTWVNERYCEITGYTASELIGMQTQEITHPEDIQPHNLRFHELTTKRGSFSIEMRYRRKDGVIIWVNNSVCSVCNSLGKPENTVTVVLDVTEQKRSEEILQRTMKDLENEKTKLERSNRELEQFASIAAHDLRSPLKSLLNWIEVLDHFEPKPRNETIDQAIAFIKTNALKTDLLIEDLLEVAGLNVSTPHLENLNLNDVICNALTLLKQKIKDLDAEVQCDTLPTVRGIASHLQSLFCNLIENALNYRVTTRRIHISIGYQEQPEFYQFFVKDNGIGIPAEYTERIFEMFKRLHSDAEYPGTGIGLAYCKKVIELRGGKIWVNSVPGEGSTFYFTYPRNAGG